MVIHQTHGRMDTKIEDEEMKFADSDSDPTFSAEEGRGNLAMGKQISDFPGQSRGGRIY